MILLSDTDIIIKLCACDLMDAALDCMNAKASDVRILNEARVIIKRQPKKYISRHGKRAFKRIQSFIDNSKMARTGSIKEQVSLVNILGIDPGEKILLTSTSKYEDFRLITADRRFLKALGEHRGLEELKGRIAGRCYCYEQILLGILDIYGIEHIQSRRTQLCKTDISFDSEFSGGKHFRKGSFILILNSRIDEIKDEAGDIMGDFTS